TYYFQATYSGDYANGIAAAGQSGTAGVTTTGSTAFSDPGASFNQDYVGAHIQINTTAPATSKTYIIASVTDATHVVLTTAFTGPSKTNASWNTSGLPVRSDCTSEPVTVVDATIAITPATASNAVGTNHTLTITVKSFPAGTALASGTANASILA